MKDLLKSFPCSIEMKSFRLSNSMFQDLDRVNNMLVLIVSSSFSKMEGKGHFFFRKHLKMLRDLFTSNKSACVYRIVSICWVIRDSKKPCSAQSAWKTASVHVYAMFIRRGMNDRHVVRYGVIKNVYARSGALEVLWLASTSTDSNCYLIDL